ncbi:cytidine deaminase [Allobacillus sp. GCM10007491]|uniref:Cytidine deaminase n=1 Tax=Allobacillus saliphilus TaxID=2912308 RepID=A0A941CVK2_9BACI|nr:cytidine deaminase [Allobacillus saliphilus]MBR7553218.1 cytidine deaminase [Allobacillus saliphilus]
MKREELMNLAKEMLDKAYVPYSKFPVGAAILMKSGKVYQGCNIENAAYPVSCCAERVAIFKAVSEGDKDFDQLAVIANTDRPVSPCGSCRQVMAEFFSPDTPIYMASRTGEIEETTIEKLLPYSFTTADLRSGQGEK